MPRRLFGPDNADVLFKRRKSDKVPTDVIEDLNAVVCQTCRPNLELKIA